MIVAIASSAHAAVVAYPRVPALATSSNYMVTAGGVSIPVTAYNGKSFAWFAFSGSVNVQVHSNASISGYVISPKSKPVGDSASGNDISFTLSTPRKLLLHKLGGTSEELFILADALESNPPVPGGSGVFMVSADGSGNTDATFAINSAINSANSAGGGVAYVPAGTYRVGSGISLKSNVNLYLAPGAILQVPATSPSYPLSSLIVAADGDHATISGRGIIYGNGTKNAGAFYWLFITENETNVRLQDVMFLDGNTTAVRFVANGAVIDNVKILSGSPNGSDGIDYESCQNITQSNNLILSSDDNNAIGAGTDPRTTVLPTDGITATGNLFYHTNTGHTVSIVPNHGTTYIRNITYDNNDSIDTQDGLSIYPFGGTNVYNVSFSNMRWENIRQKPMEIWEGDCTSWGPGNCGSPAGVLGYAHATYTNLTFDNFGSQDSQFLAWNSTSDIEVAFHNLKIAGQTILSQSAMHADYQSGNIFITWDTNGGTTPPPPPPPPTTGAVTINQASPSTLMAAAGQPVQYTLKFAGGPTAVSEQIFVHFTDSSGNIIFQDPDHYPSTLTTQWSSTYSENRTVTLPANASGSYKVMVGLFDPNTSARLSLTPGTGVIDNGDSRYQVATLTVGATAVSCDVNHDGSTNVSDVQQMVNQALHISVCTADINQDGQCNTVDVQRVINASLGGQCVSP